MTDADRMASPGCVLSTLGVHPLLSPVPRPVHHAVALKRLPRLIPRALLPPLVSVLVPPPGPHADLAPLGRPHVLRPLPQADVAPGHGEVLRRVGHRQA